MKKGIKRIFSLTGMLVLVCISANAQLPNAGSKIMLADFQNNAKIKYKNDILSMLVRAMLKEPDHTAYIVSYGNLSKLDCGAIDSLKFVHAYIHGEKKIPPKRVVYVNGGFRSSGMTEIYFEPPGADFPDLTTPINVIL